MIDFYDERVLSMRFDNDDFEKNVQDTLRSLEKLNNSLNKMPENSGHALDGLGEAVKSFTLDPISNALESVQNRFSTLGIIGATIISDLTNTVLNSAKRLASSTIGQIITGGMSRSSNIENAKFMLKGLGVVWSDISDDIDYGVKDTAYGLDAAAKAASQLVASSVQLGDDMKAALRGISGVAAMTNSDYDSIAHIFTNVAGQGKLMTMQLRELELRGLNVAANMANLFNSINDGSADINKMDANFVKAVKDLTKGSKTSESAIRDMVTDGVINFEIFSKAMNESFGEHAKEANNTLQGVLSNIRSALSRVGQIFIQPIIENEGPLVQMLNSIREKINAVKAALEPFAKEASDLTINVIKNLQKIIEGIDEIKVSEGIKTAAEVFMNFAKGVLNLASVVKTVAQSIAYGFSKIFPDNFISTKVTNISKSFLEFTTNLKESANKLGDNKIVQIFTSIGKALGAFADIIKEFGSAAFKSIGKIFDHFKLDSGSVNQVAGGFADFAISLRDSIKESGIFVTVFDKVADIVIKIGDIIKKIAGHLVDFFSGFGFVDTLKEKIGGIKDAFSATEGSEEKVLTLKDKIGGAFKSLLTFLESVINGIFSLIKKVKDVVVNFWDTLKQNTGKNSLMEIIFPGGASEITNITSSGIGIGFVIALTNLFQQLKMAVGGFKNFFSNISFDNLIFALTNLTKAAKNEINTKVIKNIATSILEIAAALLILSSIDQDKLSNALAAVTISLAELLAGYKALTTIQINTKSAINILAVSGVISTLASAIFMMAGAFVQLGKMDIKEVGSASAALTVMLGELTGAMLLLSNLSGEKSVKGSLTIIAFAGAIKIVAKSFTELGQMNWNEIGKATAGITLLISELSGAMILMSRFSKGGVSLRTGAALLALAGTIKILIEPMMELAGKSWTELAKAGAALTAFIASLSGFIILTKLSSGGKLTGAAIAVIALAAAIRIIVPAIETISNIDPGSVALAVGSISALMLMLNYLAANSKSAIKLIAVTNSLITFALAMDLLVVAFKAIGSMKIEGVLTTVGAIAGVMTIFAAMSKYTKAGDLIATAAALVIFASAIMMLTPSLLALGAAAPVAIPAFIVLAGALAIFGIAAKVLQPLIPSMFALAGALIALSVSGLIAAAAITAIGAGLIMIVSAFTTLGTLLPSAISATIVAISEGISKASLSILKGIKESIPLMVESFLSILEGIRLVLPELVNTLFELIVQVLESLTEFLPQIIPIIGKFFVALVDALIEVVPTMVGSFVKLVSAFITALSEAFKEVDTDALLEAVKDLGILGGVFLELAVVGALAIGAAIGTAATLGVLALCALLFNKIKELGVEESLPIMDKMGQVLQKFAEAMSLLALFGVAGALTTLLALEPVIASLVVILSALGGLSQIPGFNWLINEGGEVLSKLGYIIGDFVGSLIGGLTAGITSGLPEIGSNLSSFFDNVKPFLEGMKTVDESVLTGTAALAATVIAITAADVINGITSWFTGENSLLKFGESICEFAPYIVEFSKIVSGIDESAVVSAASAAKTLAEFADNIPNEGGVAGWFAGENSLIVFAEGLCEFGPKLMEFAKTVKGLNASDVENAANAGKAIAAMADSLPNQGGALAWVVGDNTLTQFAAEMAVFAPSLMKFAESVKDLPANVVENAASSAQTLSAMADNLPNQGGAVAWFTGDNTLSMFGHELMDFGAYFSVYGQEMKDIDPNIVTASANAAKALSEIAMNLPNTGGVAGFFAGNYDMDEFGRQLVGFGTGLSQFYESISTITDPEKMSSVINQIKSLADLALVLDQVDPDVFEDFMDSFSELSIEAIDKFVEEFENSEERVYLAIQTLITYIEDALLEYTPELNLKITEFAQQMLTTFDTFFGIYEEGNSLIMHQRGMYICLGLSEGLQLYSSHVLEQVRYLAEQILNAFNIHLAKDKFVTIGQHICDGLVEGIESGKASVLAAAEALASEVEQKLRNAWEINSPSKLFRRIAAGIPEGMVQGIEWNAGQVYNATEKLADNTIITMQNAMRRVYDSINEEMDTNPVIRPTLDLSDVRAKAGQVSSLFNSTQSLRAGMNAEGSPAAAGTTSYNFTQNNYSPKALSRIDIYRQTKNQFSTLKGLVNG